MKHILSHFKCSARFKWLANWAVALSLLLLTFPPWVVANHYPPKQCHKQHLTPAVPYFGKTAIKYTVFKPYLRHCPKQ